MEDKNIIYNLSAKYGVIAGAVAIAFTMYAYFTEPDFFFSLGMYLKIILVFGILIYSIISIRKIIGGYMTYKQAFTSFFLAAFVYLCVSAIFNIILFNFIDTDFSNEVQEAGIRKIEASMEALDGMGDFGEKMMEKAIENAKENNMFSIKNLTSEIFTSSVLYLFSRCCFGFFL